MFWLKSCSRCRGDIFGDRDVHGNYIACIQCGYYLTEAEEVVLRYSSSHESVVTAKEEAVEAPISI